MVHCGPQEGRHTGVLVAKKIDEIINALELPPVEDCMKTMTTDNAANMKIACRDSIAVDKHLGCIDHSLNLVVNAGLNSIPKIKNSVDSFRKLVTGCHKSHLYCDRIKKACSDLNSSSSTICPGSIYYFIYHLSSIYISFNTINISFTTRNISFTTRNISF